MIGGSMPKKLKNKKRRNQSLKTKNYVFRNPQQAILKNKNDIAAHYAYDRVVAQLGLKVYGHLTSVSDLPDTAAEIGDAYLVGETEPYILYAWTRANPDIGQPNDYWLEVGPLTVQGATPEIGANGNWFIAGQDTGKPSRGERGLRGFNTYWYYCNTANISNVWDYLPFDQSNIDGEPFILLQDGRVYYWSIENSSWTYATSIKGDQGNTGAPGPKGDSIVGPEGPQGPAGERGLGIVIIANDLDTIDEAPDPTKVRRDSGILVNIGSTKYLYVIIGRGTSTDPLRWSSMGEFKLYANGDTPAGGGSTVYRHRIYMSFGGYNNESFFGYFDYYDSSPDPYTTSTIYNILPREGHDQSMGIMAKGTTNDGDAIATSIGYYHEYDEYYTLGFEYIYLSNGQFFSTTHYGLNIIYVSDQVSQV